MNLLPEENERYSEQMALPEIGIAGQKRLKAASVLVIGAGGLGCPALQYLAASGIGKIGIADPDRIELSNLHRQILYGTQDIGKLKCEAAAEKLSLLNPHVFFDSLPVVLGNENALSLIQGYDLVVDGTDNFSARYAIDDACIELKKPWIFASVAGFTGQLALFEKASLKDLYPYPPSEECNCANAGVIGALPGVLGSMQAVEVIKILSGMGSSLSDTLLVLDGRTWKLSHYRVKEAAAPLEISYEKMLQLKNAQLIDIRNFESQNLPKDKPIVLYCQKGIRSKILAKELRRDLGRMDIYSLAINPFT